MNGMQAVQLPTAEVHQLGALRLQPGLTACEHKGSVWVRVAESSDGSATALAALPGVRYNVAADLQLTRVGQRTPAGWLPGADWLPLSEWLTVAIDPPGYSGVQTAKASLRLVRSAVPAEANMLLTTAAAWRAYAVAAPLVRLNALSFAVTGGGEVVVRGWPLPAIQGSLFVQQQGVAAPAGWAWSPQLDAGVIACSLGLQPGDVAMLHTSGSWDHLAAGDFIQATRTAVRASTIQP